MGRGKRRTAARASARPPAAVRSASRTDGLGPAVARGVSADQLALASQVRATLVASPDLLKTSPIDWRARNLAGHPMTGHCYVGTEAMHRLMGGDAAGWKSMVLAFVDDVSWRAPEPGEDYLTHWWIQTDDGRLLDVTADQFQTPVPYERGKRAAFMTNRHLAGKPSTRTQRLLERLAA